MPRLSIPNYPDRLNSRAASSHNIHALEKAAAETAPTAEATSEAAEQTSQRAEQAASDLRDAAELATRKAEHAALKAAQPDRKSAEDAHAAAQEAAEAAHAAARAAAAATAAAEHTAGEATKNQTKLAIFQQEADDLRAQLVDNKLPLFAVIKPKKAEPKALNTALLKMQWALLPAAATYETSNVLVFDYGDRGRATITDQAITLSNELGNDPKALLLTMRHAQLHWNSRAVVSGTADVRFQFAVAAKMLGVKVNWRARLQRLGRRAESKELAAEWQSILDEIRTGQASSRLAPTDRDTGPARPAATPIAQRDLAPLPVS